MTGIEEGAVCWYAARVEPQTEKYFKKWLGIKGIDHFIPFRTIVIEYNGREKKKENPLIPCIVFIRTTYDTALSLPDELGFKMSYIRNHDTREIQIVPDKQMQDCMFLFNRSDNPVPHIAGANLARGDKVRVIKGPFMGIEGESVRIKGHRRVIVRLEGILSLITPYIPLESLEKI